VRISRRFTELVTGTEVRSLLIQLSSSMLKNHIMETTTFKLRRVEKFAQLVVSHDITKQEREQCKQLVAEANLRQHLSSEMNVKLQSVQDELQIETLL